MKWEEKPRGYSILKASEESTSRSKKEVGHPWQLLLMDPLHIAMWSSLETTINFGKPEGGGVKATHLRMLTGQYLPGILTLLLKSRCPVPHSS